MLIPRYWAEARVRHRAGDRQFTVRRFGWSDASEADAQAVADQRAQDALARLLAGDSVARSEPKVPYNGADGLPIREEIVGRFGPTVLTRNSYGAVCLNTPDVLFVDVDAFLPDGFYHGCFVGFPAMILGGIIMLQTGWVLVAIAATAAVLAVGLPVVSWLERRAWRRKRAAWEPVVRAKFAEFAAAHPDWHLRLYRTPAGFRLLAMHRTFAPSDPEVAAAFAGLYADEQYAKMCQKQQCFRARVSPKPWRVGIDDHLRPRPGVWPVKPEWLPGRREWVARYDEKSRGYASCRFVERFGSETVHPAAEAVRQLHDSFCRAETDLPLA